MLADHLYERFGTPDRIIGLHDTNLLAAGTVGMHQRPSGGQFHLDRRRHPRHRRPRRRSPGGRDPITLAALYITQIQTIVSREEDPQDPTVITVGDIHGGTKRNIIPDEVKLELTTRSFSDKSRASRHRRPQADGRRHHRLRRPPAGESRHRHRPRRRVDARRSTTIPRTSPGKGHARESPRCRQRLRHDREHGQRGCRRICAADPRNSSDLLPAWARWIR